MSVNELTSAQLAQLDDPKWRRRNSRWRLIVWFSGGVYGTFVLWYVAAKLKSLKAIVAAAISTAVGGVFFVLLSRQPQLTEAELAAQEGTTRAATPEENMITAAAFVMIAFNLWMSFYLQKDWLVWAVSKKGKGSWVEENLKIKTVSRDQVRVNRTKQAKLDSGSRLFLDSSDLLAAPAEAPIDNQSVLAEPIHETASSKEQKIELDINEASLGSLLKLPGVTDVIAEKILLERQARGGFKSFEEVRIALDLKPHEVAKLQHLFIFKNIQSSGSSGRVLDV